MRRAIAFFALAALALLMLGQTTRWPDTKVWITAASEALSAASARGGLGFNRAIDRDGDGNADFFNIAGDWTGFSGGACTGIADGNTNLDDIHCAVLAVDDDTDSQSTVLVESGVYDTTGVATTYGSLIVLPSKMTLQCKPGAYLKGYSDVVMGTKTTSSIIITNTSVRNIDRSSAGSGTIDNDINVKVCKIGYDLTAGYDTDAWAEVDDEFGLYFDKVSNLRIEDNTVQDTIHSCIYVRSTTDAIIKGNILPDGCGNQNDAGTAYGQQPGIYLFASGGINQTGTIVANNVVSSAGSWGLATRSEYTCQGGGNDGTVCTYLTNDGTCTGGGICTAANIVNATFDGNNVGSVGTGCTGFRSMYGGSVTNTVCMNNLGFEFVDESGVGGFCDDSNRHQHASCGVTVSGLTVIDPRSAGQGWLRVGEKSSDIAISNVVLRGAHRVDAAVNSTDDIDATNDTIALPGHPYTTGHTQIRATLATGSMPGGMSAATTYWVIDAGPGLIQIATSEANALAGTQEDLATAVGTFDLYGGHDGYCVTIDETKNVSLSNAYIDGCADGAIRIIETGQTISGLRLNNIQVGAIDTLNDSQDYIIDFSADITDAVISNFSARGEIGPTALARGIYVREDMTKVVFDNMHLDLNEAGTANRYGMEFLAGTINDLVIRNSRILNVAGAGFANYIYFNAGGGGTLNNVTIDSVIMENPDLGAALAPCIKIDETEPVNLTIRNVACDLADVVDGSAIGFDDFGSTSLIVDSEAPSGSCAHNGATWIDSDAVSAGLFICGGGSWYNP